MRQLGLNVKTKIDCSFKLLTALLLVLSTIIIMYSADVLDGLEGLFHNAGLPIHPRPLAASFLKNSSTPHTPFISSLYRNLILFSSWQRASVHKACSHVKAKVIVCQLLFFATFWTLPLWIGDVLLVLGGNFIMQAFAFCPRLSDVPRSPCDAYWLLLLDLPLSSLTQ